MPSAVCPACRETFTIAGCILVDDWITCPHCRTDLEIICLEPPELDWAYEEPGVGRRKHKGLTNASNSGDTLVE